MLNPHIKVVPGERSSIQSILNLATVGMHEECLRNSGISWEGHGEFGENSAFRKLMILSQKAGRSDGLYCLASFDQNRGDFFLLPLSLRRYYEYIFIYRDIKNYSSNSATHKQTCTSPCAQCNKDSEGLWPGGGLWSMMKGRTESSWAAGQCWSHESSWTLKWKARESRRKPGTVLWDDVGLVAQDVCPWRVPTRLLWL